MLPDWTILLIVLKENAMVLTSQRENLNDSK